MCKLCWSCEAGRPGLITKHLATCPVVFELGAALSAKTNGAVTSILPSGFHLPPWAPPPAPRDGISSIVGKRARASNQLPPDDLQALASSKFHKRERRHKRSKVDFTGQQSQDRKSKLDAALHAHAQGEAGAKHSAP